MWSSEALHDDRIVFQDAPRFMLYYHCVRDISWSVIFSTHEMNIAVVSFQTCFGSASSAFEIIELAYIHCPLKENFSVTLIKKGFTCISLICRELLCALGRTVNTKYKTRQLISFARFTSRTQARGEPKLWLIYKVVPTKHPLRCEANYQRRIYYSIALKGAEVYNGSYK